MTGLESLQNGSEKTLANKKPQLEWRYQDIRDTNMMGHLSRLLSVWVEPALAQKIIYVCCVWQNRRDVVAQAFWSPEDFE